MMLNGNNNYAITKVVPISGGGTCLKHYQANLLPQTFQLIFCLQTVVTLKPFSFSSNALPRKDKADLSLKLKDTDNSI